MKRLLPVIAVLVMLAPTAASGQAADTVRAGSQRSALAAGLLEAFFPTAGFAYAGDWKRGFKPNAFRLAAYIGFAATADFLSSDECDGDAACQVFGVASAATAIWAIVGAVQTAREHNASVVQRHTSLLVKPSASGGVSVGVRLFP